MANDPISPKDFGASFKDFLDKMAAQGPAEGPVKYTNVALDGERVLPCVQLGLYLVCEGETRLALLRKAALFAADDGAAITIEDRHLDEALHEMVVEGGDLTKSLLGAARSMD